MNKIIFNILKKNNIDIAEDLYHYGWSIFVHYLFYLIITLSIAVYYHCVFQTIIFLFLYIPLRKYIGGSWELILKFPDWSLVGVAKLETWSC